MPRQPRTDYPGAIHHVTARGNDRQPVFRDDADNWVFLQMLAAACSTHNLVAVAWCLMGSHVHLVLESREGGLGAAMQQLTLGYAKRYSNRHHCSGHVFQGRYHSMLVNRDAYLLEVVRYVLLDPVRAGMCRSAGEWRWSSAREALDQRPCPTWADFSVIYGLLEPRNGPPADHLARFLERGHRNRQVPGAELRSVPGTS